MTSTLTAHTHSFSPSHSRHTFPSLSVCVSYWWFCAQRVMFRIGSSRFCACSYVQPTKLAATDQQMNGRTNEKKRANTEDERSEKKILNIVERRWRSQVKTISHTFLSFGPLTSLFRPSKIYINPSSICPPFVEKCTIITEWSVRNPTPAAAHNDK